MSKNISVIALVLITLSVAQGADRKKATVDVTKIPPAAAKPNVTYSADIKPLFDHSCIKCHGPEKPKAKLRLDSLEAVLKGSEAGKVVEPGHSAQSVLVHNIAHVGDPDDYMPPPDNKAKIPPLTKDQIGLIRAWIDQGSK